MSKLKIKAKKIKAKYNYVEQLMHLFSFLCVVYLDHIHSLCQVTDLHWSCSEPSLLASAGLDGSTHVWDIRDTRRPCQTYNTIVGAGHVRWSRDGQFLATAHEGDVKLWDARAPAQLSCVSVHMSRVHSVDWSVAQPGTLVTASNDCTVKFHSVNLSKQVPCVLSLCFLTLIMFLLFRCKRAPHTRA